MAKEKIHIKHDKIPAFDYQMAVKRPIPIKVFQMPEPFVVETKEGTMEGKAGDYLMIGIQGEMYPCDQEIFNKTYQFIEP